MTIEKTYFVSFDNDLIDVGSTKYRDFKQILFKDLEALFKKIDFKLIKLSNVEFR